LPGTREYSWEFDLHRKWVWFAILSRMTSGLHQE
jgi:hypothetical protein